MQEIKNISKETFQKYGYILEHNPEGNNFQVIVNEGEPVGWRLAVMRVTARIVAKLGRHPDSMESFEPLRGVVALVLAPAEVPENYEIFLLDKPVCLHRNIWHATLALSMDAEVKITENLKVGAEEYQLARPVRIAAVTD